MEFNVDKNSNNYYTFLRCGRLGGHLTILKDKNGNNKLSYYGNEFGQSYRSIEPISNSKLIGNDDYYAVKVLTTDGKTGYISPIDSEQTLLDNEIQSILMSVLLYNADADIRSILTDSNLIIKDLKSDVKYGRIKTDEELLKAKNELILEFTNNDSTISSCVKDKYYDKKTCEILAKRLYKLTYDYKKQADEILSAQEREIFNILISNYEDKCLKKLFSLSQESEKKESVHGQVQGQSQKLEQKQNLYNKQLKDAVVVTALKVGEEKAKQIHNLLVENTIVNGGTLSHSIPCSLNKYNITIENDGKVIGFVGLAEKEKGEIYTNVMAIKKEYQGYGLGEILYEFVKKHSAGYDNLMADIRSHNIGSQKLHKKVGFKIIPEEGLEEEPLVYDFSENHSYSLNLTRIKDRKPMEEGEKEKVSAIFSRIRENSNGNELSILDK